MNDGTLTIGRLARAAGVGIETIRYYQRRELLPLPEPHDGAFRHYPPRLVDRIHFIKRSQELGFSLDEIAKLLQFEDGADRRAIRSLAGAHLADVPPENRRLEANRARTGRHDRILRSDRARKAVSDHCDPGRQEAGVDAQCS